MHISLPFVSERPTLPFLLELHKNAVMHRMTFLAMMDEFDIKGKLSGKGITSRDGYPVDFIGYFIQRLGYNIRQEHDFCDFHGYRELTHQVQIFALGGKMSGLCNEIDRPASTNQSIRAFATSWFAANPVGAAPEYHTDWHARGFGYRMNFDYSTDATAQRSWGG